MALLGGRRAAARTSTSNDVESLLAAIWRVSYLAKVRGKGYKPPQTKNYGTSRILKVQHVFL